MSNDLEWGEPDAGMGHYSPHVPVSAEDSDGNAIVVCAECGAEAKDADPEAYP